MYVVRFLPGAAVNVKNLDNSVAARIFRKLQRLADNADDVEPLPPRGRLAGLFKLREGDYRIVYEIDKKKREIVVHDVGHRSEVYLK